MLQNILLATLALPFSLVASSPLTVAAATLPMNSTNSTNSTGPGSISLDDGTHKKYYFGASCTAGQKDLEQTAWSDALQYAQALASWRPGGAYQAAMNMYMGNDSGVLTDGKPGRLAEILQGMFLFARRPIIPIALNKSDFSVNFVLTTTWSSKHRWCAKCT